MTKAERTRQLIVEKTAPVFNKYGYDGTTLAMLQEATGLTKGSLYGNFTDKDEIALEVFRYSMRIVRARFAERVDRQKTARKKLLTLLSCFADYVFTPPIEGGCPLLNNAVEADDNHLTLKKAVASEIAATIAFISRLLDEGRRSGEFSNNFRSRELATVFFASVEGAIMISRVSSSDVAMKAVVRHCETILDSITIIKA